MERVSDSDRNAAIQAVETALAEGRIVQADRDQRVDQLRSAQTPSEVEMITHDLQYRGQTWATYTPPTEAPPPPSAAPPSAAPPSVPYGPAHTSSPEVAQLFGTKRTSRAPWVLIPVALFVLIGGGTLFGIIGAVSDSDDSIDFQFDDPIFDFDEFDEYDGPPAPPQLFQARDFNALRAAIRRETGSTQAFRAVIYPGHASLDLPAEPTGKRAYNYYYDGELGEPSKGQSTDERFDLARIDPAVMTRLVRQAKRTLVEDPTSWYVIVTKPGPSSDSEAWFSVYASNDFSETGYLRAALDGTVVNRYVSE